MGSTRAQRPSAGKSFEVEREGGTSANLGSVSCGAPRPEKSRNPMCAPHTNDAMIAGQAFTDTSRRQDVINDRTIRSAVRLTRAASRAYAAGPMAATAQREKTMTRAVEF